MKQLSQPYSTLPRNTDSALASAFLNRSVRGTAKDYSANGNDASVTNAQFNADGGATFTNGDFTFANTAFTTQSYWALEADGWNFYFDNGTTIYKNNVGGASLLVTITATGFTGFTGTIKEINLYTEAKSASFASFEFLRGVPDSSLVLSVTDGTEDHSRYRNVLTNNGGVVVGNGMVFDGTNSIGCGTAEILNLRTAHTIVAVLKTTGATDRAVVGKDKAGSRSFMYYIDAADKMDAQHGGSASDDADTAITETAVNICAWVYTLSDTTVRYYLNGEPDGSDSSVAQPGTNNEIFYIGRRGYVGFEQYFNGTIYWVMAFDEAKTAGWIKQFTEKIKGRY